VNESSESVKVIRRLDIEFASEQGGLMCRGWFYPAPRDDAPVIVMAHGLGGVKEMRIDAYAERFAEEGYACLAFDYRHFGASDGQPRQIIEVRRQLADWRSAVAHVRSIRPNSKIVLWGSSLAGGHVLTVAASDGRVAAVISQCPHTSGPAAVRQLSLRTIARLAVLGLCDIGAKLLGKGPVAVPLAAPADQLALMNTPGNYAAASELLATAGSAAPPNAVAARSGITIGAYSPGRHARELRCPVLFCLCTKDNVAPAGVAKQYAQQAPRPSIFEYPVGHFDIYMGDAFEKVIVDQILFLRRHVPAAMPPGLPR